MVFWQGFLLQAGLILALGAQNIFVLESGLRRQHHLWVAAVCALCDAVLIFIGVLLASQLMDSYPGLRIVFGALGVGFILYYAGAKFREAGRVEGEGRHRGIDRRALLPSIFLALGFSLLNPHVYLDTIFLVGGYSSRLATLDERLVFGAGAALFSCLWFYGLGVAAARASALLHRPGSMRLIALISGIVLSLLGLSLGIEVWGWLP